MTTTRVPRTTNFNKCYMVEDSVRQAIQEEDGKDDALIGEGIKGGVVCES